MARPAGAQPLSAERIYEAGLAIVDEHGLEGLSMRRLGAALGVDPMAIYHHVPNKDALVHGMVRRVFASMPEPEERGAWTRRVRQWVRAYRGVVEAHPGLVLKIVTDPEAVALAAGEANESLYRALRLSGLRRAEIEKGAAVVVDYVNGWMLAKSGDYRGGGRDRERDAELDRLFDFGLAVVIAGLDQLVARRRHRQPARREGDAPPGRGSTV